MEQINTKVKKWGNSFGIILPKILVNEQNIKEGTSVNVFINIGKKTTVRDLMNFSKKNNLHKKSKKSTEEIMKEVDKELWNVE